MPTICGSGSCICRKKVKAPANRPRARDTEAGNRDSISSTETEEWVDCMKLVIAKSRKTLATMVIDMALHYISIGLL